MPILVSVMPILNAPRSPMRVSQVQSQMAPIVNAWPVQAATSGLGNDHSRTASSPPPFPTARMASMSPPVMIDRSNPAQNDPGRPASTTAFAMVSASSSAAFRSSSA